MSFTSVLKQVGTDFEKGLLFAARELPSLIPYGSILNSFLPASVRPMAAKIEAAAPTIVIDIGKVEDIVKGVEGLHAMSGGSMDKFTAATNLTATALSDFMDIAGHSVGDQTLFDKAKGEFQQACALLVQAKVDLLNSLQAKQ